MGESGSQKNIGNGTDNMNVMKYFTQLNAIDECVHQLNGYQSILYLIASSDMVDDDVQKSLYVISQNLEELSSKISDQMNSIWDQDREESRKVKNETVPV